MKNRWLAGVMMTALLLQGVTGTGMAVTASDEILDEVEVAEEDEMSDDAEWDYSYENDFEAEGIEEMEIFPDDEYDDDEEEYEDFDEYDDYYDEDETDFIYDEEELYMPEDEEIVQLLPIQNAAPLLAGYYYDSLSSGCEYLKDEFYEVFTTEDGVKESLDQMRERIETKEPEQVLVYQVLQGQCNVLMQGYLSYFEDAASLMADSIFNKLMQFDGPVTESALKKNKAVIILYDYQDSAIAAVVQSIGEDLMQVQYHMLPEWNEQTFNAVSKYFQNMTPCKKLGEWSISEIMSLCEENELPTLPETEIENWTDFFEAHGLELMESVSETASEHLEEIPESLKTDVEAFANLSSADILHTMDFYEMNKESLNDVFPVQVEAAESEIEEEDYDRSILEAQICGTLPLNYQAETGGETEIAVNSVLITPHYYQLPEDFVENGVYIYLCSEGRAIALTYVNENGYLKITASPIHWESEEAVSDFFGDWFMKEQ